MVKKKNKSSTKKNLGVGSPVICIFFVYPLPNYPGLFKDMGKTEVRRKGGWGALAHNNYKSLD